MNIFLTGGTGFIGSHFLKLIKDKDFNVTVLKRNNNSFIRQDIGFEPTWIYKSLDNIFVENLQDFDVLIHLASEGVSPRKSTLDDLLYWNVVVLSKLIRFAIKANIKRIILAGTYAEYGLSANNYEFIPVTAALKPTSNYAASKAAAFEVTHALCIENRIELVYLRIFSAYGEGQNELNLWPQIKEYALSGKDFPMTFGTQIRDFIPVENVANSILESIQRKDINKDVPLILNIGTGKGQSILNFTEYWWNYWGATGKLLIGTIKKRDFEPNRYVALISE